MFACRQETKPSGCLVCCRLCRNKPGLEHVKDLYERCSSLTTATTTRVQLWNELPRRLPRVSLHLIEVRFSPENAHVGSARRLAMDRAFSLAPHNSVLLSTDADAIPRHDWVEANLRAIASGADLVGGHIVGNKQEEAFTRAQVRSACCAALILCEARGPARLPWLIQLPHDPWPRHSDHTGASLAVRSEVYAAVGGMPALPFREDIAFVENVCRAGYRLRHPLNVQVTVSARLDGRAAGGMSDCLKSWLAAEESGLPHLVEDPQAIILSIASSSISRPSHKTYSIARR